MFLSAGDGPVAAPHPHTALFEGCMVKAPRLGLGCRTGGCCQECVKCPSRNKQDVMMWHRGGPNVAGIVEENRPLATADHRSESVF